MKNILKGLLTVSFFATLLTACTSSPQKGPTISTPHGHRIYIPQEKIMIERAIPPKVMPNSYRNWLMIGSNQSRARDYERFLEKNSVGNIIPSFELFKTARDWDKCGKSEYMIPSEEIWRNQLPTLKVFKYLVASKVLTDFTVTSVYRDLPLNQCAGGASSSRHLFNSAIDFRIGPEYPQPEDYAYIENTKFKLCQFWSQYGQSLNMGLGLYASGQIHIDTQGYRTWGPDLTRNSSMCNF
ncbi:D-Ala-D-Ala carboxypeptidase family metallohydrolase [Acinetobacter rongchengensis]|uniref:Peptidase M15 n=1 Tax=Acinetobacter rongchengensis TaxID=2419601 RepID=A0A3A8ESX6_9GAMM|nr:D-Ala-D-Ala carboxypeptidase family metallohydrolase [Acinetobacter rongchengensis]RKG37249.1 peptidase M15 [Acinetobacter rongchengensis]